VVPAGRRKSFVGKVTTVRLTRYFAVGTGALPEELGRYPDALAAPLRSASDAERYRAARAIARRVAGAHAPVLATDAGLRAVFARLATVDPAATPADLAEEADQVSRAAEARAVEATGRVGQLPPDEYMAVLTAPRLAQLARATLMTPAAAALASTLVALQNLYLEVEAELDLRRLLRVRDRVIDDTGHVRPWPGYAGLASRVGPRMTAPLERAGDGALRRLCLAYARVAAATLPRPRPDPVRKLGRACRRYAADVTDEPQRARIHAYAGRYAGKLSDRVQAAEDYFRRRTADPAESPEFRRIEQLGLVAYVFEVATRPDVFDALDWTFERTSDALERPLLNRVRRRCERALRTALGPTNSDAG
jgi:hypothetical protein